MAAHYRDDEWDRWEEWEARMEHSARPHFSPGARSAQMEEDLMEIALELRGIRPNPLIPGKGRGEGE